MTVLGIDPGITGAVVKIEPCFTLPPLVLDFDECFSNGILSCNLLTAEKRDGDGIVYAFIEEQRPFAKAGRTMGVKSAFALGENYGFWKGALEQYAQVIVVPVREWQRYHFGSGTTISDPKVRSMRAATMKAPGFPVNGKHGRADALLIALYGLAKVKRMMEK